MACFDLRPQPPYNGRVSPEQRLKEGRAMVTSIVVEPMTVRFVLWRCLHGGPLSPETIERWSPDDRLDWQTLRARNVPLLIAYPKNLRAGPLISRPGSHARPTIEVRAAWEPPRLLSG